MNGPSNPYQPPETSVSESSWRFNIYVLAILLLPIAGAVGSAVIASQTRVNTLILAPSGFFLSISFVLLSRQKNSNLSRMRSLVLLLVCNISVFATALYFDRPLWNLSFNPYVHLAIGSSIGAALFAVGLVLGAKIPFFSLSTFASFALYFVGACAFSSLYLRFATIVDPVLCLFFCLAAFLSLLSATVGAVWSRFDVVD